MAQLVTSQHIYVFIYVYIYIIHIYIYAAKLTSNPRFRGWEAEIDATFLLTHLCFQNTQGEDGLLECTSHFQKLKLNPRRIFADASWILYQLLKWIRFQLLKICLVEEYSTVKKTVEPPISKVFLAEKSKRLKGPECKNAIFETLGPWTEKSTIPKNGKVKK